MTALALTVAYVLLISLLLLLSLQAPYHWYTKTGVILLCSAFYAVVWHTLPRLQGWPIDQSLPQEFQLVSQHIVQPDKHKGTAGVIHMWVIDLTGEGGQPPRAYQLPYTEQLHRQIITATDSGRPQKGRRSKQPAGNNTPGIPSTPIHFQPMPVNRPPPKD